MNRIEPVAVSILSLVYALTPRILVSIQPSSRIVTKLPRYPSTLKLNKTPRPDRPPNRANQGTISVRKHATRMPLV
jgi:hypothetical protein